MSGLTIGEQIAKGLGSLKPVPPHLKPKWLDETTYKDFYDVKECKTLTNNAVKPASCFIPEQYGDFSYPKDWTRPTCPSSCATDKFMPFKLPEEIRKRCQVREKDLQNLRGFTPPAVRKYPQ